MKVTMMKPIHGFASDAYVDLYISNFSCYMLTYVSFLAVRHYEVVYLIHEDCVDEVESVISKVQGAFWTS